MKLLVITGMSGSGKTIALHTLEDNGFYCTDNLPICLLESFVGHLISERSGVDQVAVGMDVRAKQKNLNQLPKLIEKLRAQGIECEVIFIEAKHETLIKRFSETRRKHPLSNSALSLDEAIEKERELLAPLNDTADLRIDTSKTTLHELRELIRKRVSIKGSGQLSVLFQSFGYKHGVPHDADFVFDVRCLPNPHWKPDLRPLSGLSPEVAGYLEQSKQTKRMRSDLIRFLEHWIPCFEEDGRSYLTIAVGCTGGQHRSVYLANELYNHFNAKGGKVLSRHRELS